MKVLVTGAPGWLGTRLTEVLREKNRGVRCIVLPQADDSYMKSLGVEIFKADLSDVRSLRGCSDDIKTVFHCAGIVHPKTIKDFYSVNYKGTKNLLEEAIGAGVERFIHVSSNSPAGINISREKLMKEEDPPRPYKHYGLSKFKAEKAVNQAFKEGRIKGTIIRPCWFYGIRQPDRQTTFFRMIKKGNPIVFGNGSNLRSMSYIDNVISALLLAEEKDVAIGKTYWVADARPYSTIEIYETIARLLDVKNFRPRFVPGIVSTMCEIADTLIQGIGLYVKEIHVAGEMDKDIACSVEKAQRELGYHPEIGLEEGMRRSIEWCRDNGIEI
ncbi:MAG: NAD(P)-dependent oxidoreductase [Candidatus Omnitrophica bacterium]|nr:NAD(P)-dependent oxidoreductase [Candidatus Omnitrophota bacterium]